MRRGTEGNVPRYRFQLKARIVISGFRTTLEFAKKAEVAPARVSRVITGYEYPSITLQKKMASVLGIDLKQFGDLL